MVESSRDRFVRLAEKRVTSALKAIDLIGNLSNRSNYSYQEDDVDKMFAALNKELRLCQAKFKQTVMRKDKDFSLNE